MEESRPVLVFLHEGLGSSQQWKDFPELLSQQLNCPALLYDRVRYGKSDATQKPFYNHYMHDEAFDYLPALLKELQIKEKVILIGHSDGGSIALLYAAQYPKKALAIITLADHVFCEDITLKGVAGVLHEYKTGKLKEQLEKYHKEKTDELFYGWSGFWLSEQAKSWSIESYLRHIKAPVLAFQGKSDKFGSDEQLAAKLKHIKGDINISYLDYCAHVPHVEQASKVLHKIKCFIEGVISEKL